MRCLSSGVRRSQFFATCLSFLFSPRASGRPFFGGKIMWRDNLGDGWAEEEEEEEEGG